MTGKDKQMKYTIVIEEILRKEVSVEAKDAEEAEAKIKCHHPLKIIKKKFLL